MDQDIAVVCSSCQKRTAVRGWIHVYPTLQQATMFNAPDFLGAFIPGPGLVKVEICLSCGRFGQFDEYTEQELEQLKKYTEDQKKATESGNKLGALFGQMTGKKP